MSILEIGNRLRDATQRAARGARVSDLLSQAELTEDAVRDWARKYPGDPWLPLDGAKVVHLYRLMATQNAITRMRSAYVWLVAHYARQPYTIWAGRDVASIDARQRR
jgi:hypothetical protein